ncbi:MAG TPA: hypothetical protein VF691_19230 [Cytophagaceae bacterium]|jgi:hypothetical protein
MSNRIEFKSGRRLFPDYKRLDKYFGNYHGYYIGYKQSAINRGLTEGESIDTLAFYYNYPYIFIPNKPEGNWSDVEHKDDPLEVLFWRGSSLRNRKISSLLNEYKIHKDFCDDFYPIYNDLKPSDEKDIKKEKQIEIAERNRVKEINLLKSEITRRIEEDLWTPGEVDFSEIVLNKKTKGRVKITDPRLIARINNLIYQFINKKNVYRDMDCWDVEELEKNKFSPLTPYARRIKLKAKKLYQYLYNEKVFTKKETIYSFIYDFFQLSNGFFPIDPKDGKAEYIRSYLKG